MKDRSSGRGLGWFSLGVGLAEMMATRMVSKALNMERRPGLLRLFGAREVGTGLGLLARQRRAPWIWARVAGDVMDLVALGTAFTEKKRRRGRIGAALAAVAGVTLLDIFYGRRMSKAH